MAYSKKTIGTQIALCIMCLLALAGCDGSNAGGGQSRIDKLATRVAEQPVSIPKFNGSSSAASSLVIALGITQQLINTSFPLHADFYNPGGQNIPVVILIHGAAGMSGDRAERYEGFARKLMQAGMLAVVVHYFEAPKTQWAEAISSSIDAIKRFAPADPNRIGILGYSLGGTLALSIISHRHDIQALGICSGYIPPGFQAAAVTYVPNMFIQSGALDEAAKTVELVRDARARMGMQTEWHIYSGEGHEALATKLDQEWNLATDFMVRSFSMVVPNATPKASSLDEGFTRF